MLYRCHGNRRPWPRNPPPSPIITLPPECFLVNPEKPTYDFRLLIQVYEIKLDWKKLFQVGRILHVFRVILMIGWSVSFIPVLTKFSVLMYVRLYVCTHCKAPQGLNILNEWILDAVFDQAVVNFVYLSDIRRVMDKNILLCLHFKA
jgi:hypothetical protein